MNWASTTGRGLGLLFVTITVAFAGCAAPQGAIPSDFGDPSPAPADAACLTAKDISQLISGDGQSAVAARGLEIHGGEWQLEGVASAACASITIFLGDAHLTVSDSHLPNLAVRSMEPYTRTGSVTALRSTLSSLGGVPLGFGDDEMLHRVDVEQSTVARIGAGVVFLDSASVGRCVCGLADDAQPSGLISSDARLEVASGADLTGLTFGPAVTTLHFSIRAAHSSDDAWPPIAHPPRLRSTASAVLLGIDQQWAQTSPGDLFHFEEVAFEVGEPFLDGLASNATVGALPWARIEPPEGWKGTIEASHAGIDVVARAVELCPAWEPRFIVGQGDWLLVDLVGPPGFGGASTISGSLSIEGATVREKQFQLHPTTPTMRLRLPSLSSVCGPSAPGPEAVTGQSVFFTTDAGLGGCARYGPGETRLQVTLLPLGVHDASCPAISRAL